MEIVETRHGAVTVLKPVGPLVGADVTGFNETVSKASSRSLGRFVIDVSAVPFTDSAGLEALADAADGLAESGQVLRLCGANETLREVLQLTGLDGSFEHFADAAAAARSFL